MQCNQCVALMINGVYYHEIGCPNRGKKYRPTFDRWMTDDELMGAIDLMDFKPEWD